jgi:hypothetical protein
VIIYQNSKRISVRAACPAHFYSHQRPDAAVHRSRASCKEGRRGSGVTGTFRVLTEQNLRIFSPRHYCTFRCIILYAFRLHKGDPLCVRVYAISSSASCRRNAALSAGMSDGILLLLPVPSCSCDALTARDTPGHRTAPPRQCDAHTHTRTHNVSTCPAT